MVLALCENDGRVGVIGRDGGRDSVEGVTGLETVGDTLVDTTDSEGVASVAGVDVGARLDVGVVVGVGVDVDDSSDPINPKRVNLFFLELHDLRKVLNTRSFPEQGRKFFVNFIPYHTFFR
jgi:hypothetical protein